MHAKNHINNSSNPSLLIERIIDSISKHNIQNYLLYETVTDSEELFFIKKECTLKRNKLTTKCEVTIYHDFEENGKDFRGSASFIADLNMSPDELDDRVLSAYHSAISVKNPYYKLPASDRMFVPAEGSQADSDDIVDTTFNNAGTFNHLCKAENSNPFTIYNGMDIADMIYKNDTDSRAFINSLEIFVTNQFVHIINSNGINVSYNDVIYSGEYVVQAKTPNDVELYQDFKYSYLDNGIELSLSDKVKSSLHAIKERSVATPVNHINNGKLHYDRLILEGPAVYDLFCYYLRRLDASMIYPQYSHFHIGEPVICQDVQVTDNSSDNLTKSDTLNVTLTPKVPYSSEGIRLINAMLIKDNVAEYITGNARFSYYLGIKPIGTYESYRLDCGNVSVEEMQKTPYLKIVNFSDFQMDEFTGQFGGEFRLGYYYYGKDRIPVTNGSISGNINDYVTKMQLSSEKQTSYHFEGPLAVSFFTA